MFSYIYEEKEQITTENQLYPMVQAQWLAMATGKPNIGKEERDDALELVEIFQASKILICFQKWAFWIFTRSLNFK